MGSERKILLVAPKSVNRIGKYYDFPLGIAYISSVLKNANFNVECLNLNHHLGTAKNIIQKEIRNKNIDVVATGGLNYQYEQIYEIISSSKKLGMITILGGGIFSGNPRIAFNVLKPDFGVLFEGEETIVELCNFLENKQGIPSNIKGLVYQQKNGCEFTGEREPIRNLDVIPYPDYEGFEVKKYLDLQTTLNFYPLDYPRSLPMITSRSCKFKCSFCFHPLGDSYRIRSLDNFFDELWLLKKKYNLNMIAIYDELFGFSGEWLTEFCSRMKETGLKWWSQIRVTTKLTDDIMEMMKDSGLFGLGFGLESAVNTVLKSMGKEITIQQIEHVLELTRRHQIGIRGNFIFGDTSETKETANQTLMWYRNHPEYIIPLNPIYVYAGTKLYEVAKSKGLIQNESEYIKLHHPTVNVSKLSDDEYRNLRRKLVIANVQRMWESKSKILSCLKLEDTVNGTFYDLTVECPQCKSINHFKRFNVDRLEVLDSEGVFTACRVCNQTFAVFFPSLFSKVFSHLNPLMFDHMSRAKRKILKKIYRCN